MLCRVTSPGLCKLCEAQSVFTKPFTEGSLLTFMQIGFQSFAPATSQTVKPDAHTKRLGVSLDLWSAWYLPHTEMVISIPEAKNVW